jgi:hypothetical protein
MDRNTRFFHLKAKIRGHQNRICNLRREDGSIATSKEDIARSVVEYYSNLFAAQDHLEPSLVTRYMQRKITPEMNELLCAPFTREEITKALFMMKPNSSPGIDGFTAGFYQNHWDTMKDSICNAVLDFLNGGDMPMEMNRTILVLIHKVKHPQSIS